MAGHVFISHGSENRDEASELCAFIESHGVRAWIAPRDVRPGIDYSEALQAAIEGCTAFVVLVTEMANKSPYVRAETEMAFSNSKPIFPVRLADIKPAPGLAFFLKIRHWTDAYGKGREESLDRLALELRTLSGLVPAQAPPEPDPAPPPPPSPSPEAAPAPLDLAKAPAAPPAASATPATPADSDRLAAAIGPNAPWYLERWRLMDARNSQIQWNWPACLANIFWFAYRKMWLPVAALAVFIVLITVLGMLSRPLGVAASFLSLAAAAATGALGTSFYRRHVGNLVAGTAGLDRDAALAQIRARGGVSRQAVLIAAAVALAATALVVLVAMRRGGDSQPFSDDPFFQGGTSGESGDLGDQGGDGSATGFGTIGTDSNVAMPPAVDDATLNRLEELRNQLEESMSVLEQQQNPPPDE